MSLPTSFNKKSKKHAFWPDFDVYVLTYWATLIFDLKTGFMSLPTGLHALRNGGILGFGEVMSLPTSFNKIGGMTDFSCNGLGFGFIRG